MSKQPSPAPTDRPSLIKQLMTPPLAYVVYLIAVMLVGGLSFYVGTLRPSKHPTMGPPAMAPAPGASVPQSK